MQAQWFGAVLVILGAIGWGSLGIASTQLSQLGLSNLSITGMRIVGSFVVLLLLIPLFYNSIRMLQRKHLPALVMQSLVGMLGMTLCYFSAVHSLGPAVAVALLYTAPIWSVVLSFVFLKEQLSLKSILLTSIAVVGVACMMAGNAELKIVGVLFGLASGLCYAAYGVMGKAIVDHYQPKFLLFSSMTVSALALLPFLDAAELSAVLQHVTAGTAWALFLLIVVGTLLPFALYTQGLKYLKASQASIYTIFEPLTAVLLAACIVGIQLSFVQVFGIILIISVSLFNVLLTKDRVLADQKILIP